MNLALAKIVMILAFTLALAAPAISAQAPRVEERGYLINTSECNLPTATVARLCFDIRPDEQFVHVHLEETSPTSSLGLPIVARTKFNGVPSLAYDVCGSRLIEILPGATGIIVEVQQGEHSGFCSDATEMSPAIRGKVTLTFN